MPELALHTIKANRGEITTVTNSGQNLRKDG
jgi:hypothetical protein